MLYLLVAGRSKTRTSSWADEVPALAAGERVTDVRHLEIGGPREQPVIAEGREQRDDVLLIHEAEALANGGGIASDVPQRASPAHVLRDEHEVAAGPEHPCAGAVDRRHRREVALPLGGGGGERASSVLP
jgi:hypothetical protein